MRNCATLSCSQTAQRVPARVERSKEKAQMYKLIMPAIAATLLLLAGRAAGAEFTLTCAWDLGSKFEIKISDKTVIKNGRTVTDQAVANEEQISWHETSSAGFDYDYSINRHSGVLIASTFSKTYSRKVENKAICVKAGGGSEPGF